MFLTIFNSEENIQKNFWGKRFQEHLIEWADDLAASNNGSCFEQEKLRALHEEDAWNFLRNSFLEDFTIQSSLTVTSQLSQYEAGEWMFYLNSKIHKPD